MKSVSPIPTSTAFLHPVTFQSFYRLTRSWTSPGSGRSNRTSRQGSAYQNNLPSWKRKDAMFRFHTLVIRPAHTDFTINPGDVPQTWYDRQPRPLEESQW